MNITKQSIVGVLVAADYRTASVFKQYNIDFCCNGNRTLEKVCAEQQLPVDELMSGLNNAAYTEKANIDYQFWSIDLLAEYIEQKHHKYVTNTIEEIKPYLQKITMVHGNRHPELSKIKSLFDNCAGELLQHMKKEELMLFPYIKRMMRVKEDKSSAMSSPFGSVQNLINMMHAEHDHEGERFRQIAALSTNYAVPPDGCNTYRVTMALLQEFEEDLHLHIHLENNILFPKAIALEKEITANA